MFLESLSLHPHIYWSWETVGVLEVLLRFVICSAVAGHIVLVPKGFLLKIP